MRNKDSRQFDEFENEIHLFTDWESLFINQSTATIKGLDNFERDYFQCWANAFSFNRSVYQLAGTSKSGVFCLFFSKGICCHLKIKTDRTWIELIRPNTVHRPRHDVIRVPFEPTQSKLSHITQNYLSTHIRDTLIFTLCGNANREKIHLYIVKFHIYMLLYMCSRRIVNMNLIMYTHNSRFFSFILHYSLSLCPMSMCLVYTFGRKKKTNSAKFNIVKT